MSTRPKARIVVIGNEVLSGKVLDQNTPFLLGRLRTLGVKCVGVVIVSDALEEIAAAVRAASDGADFVITTGGIGPTHDDLTIEAVAQAFDVAVIESPALRDLIETRWTQSRGEARFRMARVPEGAVLAGDPAFPTVEFRNVHILPGVPRLVRGRFAAIEARFRAPPCTANRCGRCRERASPRTRFWPSFARTRTSRSAPIPNGGATTCG